MALEICPDVAGQRGTDLGGDSPSDADGEVLEPAGLGLFVIPVFPDGGERGQSDIVDAEVVDRHHLDCWLSGYKMIRPYQCNCESV